VRENVVERSAEPVSDDRHRREVAALGSDAIEQDHQQEIGGDEEPGASRNRASTPMPTIPPSQTRRKRWRMSALRKVGNPATSEALKNGPHGMRITEDLRGHHGEGAGQCDPARVPEGDVHGAGVPKVRARSPERAVSFRPRPAGSGTGCGIRPEARQGASVRPACHRRSARRPPRFPRCGNRAPPARRARCGRGSAGPGE